MLRCVGATYRFQRANGVHDVLGPVLVRIDSRVRFLRRVVRSEVAAVDSLDHADESVGVRGSSHNGDPRKRVRPTVVRLWPTAARLGQGT